MRGIRSRPLAVLVRPLITSRLTGPELVGSPLSLRFAVRPASAGTLLVRISRDGRARAPRVYRGSASLRLDTRQPASFGVRATLRPARGFAAVTRSIHLGVRPAATLAPGTRGASVSYLQSRLRELRFALRSVNGEFGSDTYEAVVAFQKAVGLARTGRVDPGVWRALERANVPAPRLLTGTHIEVDTSRQLLFAVRDGRVDQIVHVSTGTTGNTPVGRWHIYRKVAGWDWVLWYPMYFLGGFAVHGYPSVPPFPASHGCVRIPMWLAPSLFTAYPYGSLVWVY